MAKGENIEESIIRIRMLTDQSEVFSKDFHPFYVTVSSEHIISTFAKNNLVFERWKTLY
jgi:hypothetical protein